MLAVFLLARHRLVILEEDGRNQIGLKGLWGLFLTDMGGAQDTGQCNH